MDSRPSFRLHLDSIQGHSRFPRELLLRFSQSPADPRRLVVPLTRFPASHRRALFSPVAREEENPELTSSIEIKSDGPDPSEHF